MGLDETLSRHKRVTVCRAQANHPDVPTEPVLIHIAHEMPPLAADAGARLFRRHAVRLADTLHGHLPGGTLHQLTAEMIVRMGNRLRIPQPVPDFLPEPQRRRAAQLAAELRHMIELEQDATPPNTPVSVLGGSLAVRHTLEYLDATAQEP